MKLNDYRRELRAQIEAAKTVSYEARGGEGNPSEAELLAYTARSNASAIDSTAWQDWAKADARDIAAGFRDVERKIMARLVPA